MVVCKRIVPAALRRYFGPPESIYTRTNQAFRDKLNKEAQLSLIERILNFLERRIGLRMNSKNNLFILLGVVLTSVLVFNDTVADTITSAEKWARPIFLPALWAIVFAIYFLIQAVRFKDSDINPTLAYRGDEVEKAATQYFGVATPEEIASLEIDQRQTALAQLDEVASRADFERSDTRDRRYYMNKALKAVLVAVVLYSGALSAYAIIGAFL